jgi:hypothetical protein
MLAPEGKMAFAQKIIVPGPFGSDHSGWSGMANPIAPSTERPRCNNESVPVQSRRTAMLQDFMGQRIVVDMRSPFVCLGTLQRIDELWLELVNADFHDLRDTQSTRELYVADSRATGIKRNRKRVLVVRADVVAVSLLDDVVDE